MNLKQRLLLPIKAILRSITESKLFVWKEPFFVSISRFSIHAVQKSKFKQLGNLPLALIIIFLQLNQLLAKDSFQPEESKQGFIENKGQILQQDGRDADFVAFCLEAPNTKVFLLNSPGIAYQFEQRHYPEGYQELMDKKFLDPDEQSRLIELEQKIRLETYRMDMVLQDANPKPQILTEGRSADYINYYNQNVLDVHHFQKITYKDVYPGIDWVLYATLEGFKYDFVVRPGADPYLIQLEFKDHEELKINPDGSLSHNNRLGSFIEKAPISFQDEIEIQTKFAQKGNVLSFDVAAYDPNKILKIDPSRIWGTYFAGNAATQFVCTSASLTGAVYTGGNTGSNLNIAFSGHQNTFGGDADAILVKFDGSGNRLWATYYGGTGQEHGLSLDVDRSGNVLLGGYTTSPNGIAIGGYDNTFNSTSYQDAFAVKFDSNGVRIWGTYYGGDNHDNCNSISSDSFGNIYICGSTSSSTSIATAGSHQTALAGGFLNAFLVKLSPSGIRLWATYYGSYPTSGYGVATDTIGNVYMTGFTGGGDISFAGHQMTLGGVNNDRDAFLVKFDQNGTRLWGTFYGGSSDDRGYSCTVDGMNNVYLSGYTSSTNNIAFNGYQNQFNGGTVSQPFDAFLVKFNSTGNRLWGTYYGGGGHELGYSCSTDDNGNVYLAGETNSTTDVSFGGHQSTFGGGNYDSFLAKFTGFGARQWATYYGGNNDENTGHVAPAVGNSVYLAGYTNSPNNIAANGFQNSLNGSFSHGFLVKFLGCQIATSSDSIISCSSYTWQNGITYTANNSTATFTLANASVNGCDSIITLNLTINQPTFSTLVLTSCDSISVNGQQYNQSGSFTQVIPNSVGCDSIISLNITITHPTIDSISITACDSIQLNGNTYYQSGAYVQSLTNVNNCDSMIFLSLTINESTTSVFSDSACRDYILNGQVYSQSGTYLQTINNGNGCDSIITLELFVGQESFAFETISGCGSVTVNGSTYTQSGQVTNTYTNFQGCDSIVETSVIVNPIPQIQLTVDTLHCLGDNPMILQSTPSGGMWFGAGVSGITFTPSNAGIGTHTLLYTFTSSDGCSNSASVDVTVESCVGVEIAQQASIIVYPNPVAGTAMITFSGEYSPTDYRITLLNALGQELSSNMVLASSFEIDFSKYTAGIYYLHLVDVAGKTISIKRLLKQ